MVANRSGRWFSSGTLSLGVALALFGACHPCPNPTDAEREAPGGGAAAPAAPAGPGAPPPTLLPAGPASGEAGIERGGESGAAPGVVAALGADAVPEPIRNAVRASDRSAEDVALDAGRKPEELFTFFRIAPGQRVAELGAGGGHTAELLARIVGPAGKVYAQNPRWVLERYAEAPWSARLTKPVMAPVVRVDREFAEPLPPEARDLDAVLLIYFYHDAVWTGVDRDRMNLAAFSALRRGGIYGIADHAAATGAGTSVAESLHRIEQTTVVSEVERAGFVLDAKGDFLRNEEDLRDWNVSPRVAGGRRGTSDRFVLRFRKPPVG